MNFADCDKNDAAKPAGSILAHLQRLDLATEVLEGLDELGVCNRAQLLELMEHLERQITDDDQSSVAR